MAGVHRARPCSTAPLSRWWALGVVAPSRPGGGDRAQRRSARAGGALAAASVRPEAAASTGAPLALAVWPWRPIGGRGAAPVIRHLLLLTVVLAAVAAADGWLRLARDSGRAEAAVLRGILPASGQVEPDRVRTLSLQVPGSSPWVYERRGGTWRFPAYFGAYAHSGRVDRLLHEVLGAGGHPGHHGRGRLRRPRRLRSRGPFAWPWPATPGSTSGKSGSARGVPGPAGDESYVRRAGSDSVLHLHANPLLTGGRRPPSHDRPAPAAPRRARRSRGRGARDGAAGGGLPAAASAGPPAGGWPGPAPARRRARALPLAARAGVGGGGELRRRQRLGVPLPTCGRSGWSASSTRRPRPATASPPHGWS